MKLSISMAVQPTKFGDIAFAGDFEHSLASVAGMGYDAVELQIRDPQALDLAVLERLLLHHGLTMCVIATGPGYLEDGLSLGHPDPEVRVAAERRIESQIDLGQQTGAMVMIGLMRGRLQSGMNRDAMYDLLVGSHRRLAQYATERSVRIVVEPVNRYQEDLILSTQDGLAFLERVGYPNVGLVLDSYHMNIEDRSLEDSLREAGDKLFHIHISDSNRKYAGAGHIDYASFLRTLSDMGYAGYLTGEIMAAPDAETAARRNIEHLRRLLAG